MWYNKYVIKGGDLHRERKEIPMKYTVSINEKNRSITVTLPDGTKGTARCCPTDRFDINTGIELALERAKVAKANKNKPTAPTTVMELVKALEKALPKGQVVVVGNGNGLTEVNKKWLISLAGGCSCKKGKGYDKGYDDGYAEGYEEGHTDGYTEGYDEANAEWEEASCDCEYCEGDDIPTKMTEEEWRYLTLKVLGIIED